MKKIDFAGNERIIEQLGCLLDSKRFPHAVVIEGAQGLGKRTLARLLATALVCRGEEKPCMECTQCRKAQENIHPDIFEYSASGGINSFHVDVVRNVISDAYVQPNEAEHKVYILGNADCMSISAQNALLKVLEEPPQYAVFILTAQSKSSLLETVLSRSVVISLEGVDVDKGAGYISSHFEGISFDDARSALEIYNGNIGKAVGSFSDSRQNELSNVCCDICKALVEDSEYSLLCACSAFQKDRESVVFACEFFKKYF
ncbi:MAG: ATP-binding protein [Eubacterium sp.]